AGLAVRHPREPAALRDRDRPPGVSRGRVDRQSVSRTVAAGGPGRDFADDRQLDVPSPAYLGRKHKPCLVGGDAVRSRAMRPDPIVAEFDAQLVPAERALVELARRFGCEQVAPRAREWTRGSPMPLDLLRAACELGLARIELATEQGGLGL